MHALPSWQCIHCTAITCTCCQPERAALRRVCGRHQHLLVLLPAGDLQARHVVAERLKGLEAGAGVTAAEAVRHAPATPEREQRGSTGRHQGGTVSCLPA
jgi:hypothetical protein